MYRLIAKDCAVSYGLRCVDGDYDNNDDDNYGDNNNGDDDNDEVDDNSNNK